MWKIILASLRTINIFQYWNRLYLVVTNRTLEIPPLRIQVNQQNLHIFEK